MNARLWLCSHDFSPVDDHTCGKWSIFTFSFFKFTLSSARKGPIVNSFYSSKRYNCGSNVGRWRSFIFRTVHAGTFPFVISASIRSTGNYGMSVTVTTCELAVLLFCAALSCTGGPVPRARVLHREPAAAILPHARHADIADDASSLNIAAACTSIGRTVEAVADHHSHCVLRACVCQRRRGCVCCSSKYAVPHRQQQSRRCAGTESARTDDAVVYLGAVSIHRVK